LYGVIVVIGLVVVVVVVVDIIIKVYVYEGGAVVPIFAERGTALTPTTLVAAEFIVDAIAAAASSTEMI
jgi:hypothetical protein